MADREDRGIVLALKSGNFGDEELFVRAAKPLHASRARSSGVDA
jgi:uncharacterized protein YgbK (DUF1537 family)